jgi:deoxyribose-phosphate aldolase
MNYNKFFDHTCLKADATLEDIQKLCAEAKQYDFMSVCVNPFYVPVVKKLLKGSDVKVCTVIAFPLGQMTPAGKVAEAEDAIRKGADEVDMVQNIAMAKEHNYAYIAKEISLVKKAVGPHVLKVILENCYLSKDEIKNCCLAAKKAGADFVKTSTGFGTGGATAEDVALMRQTIGDKMGVKAAGGIHNKAQMLELLSAGATRIGCSHSVEIMNEK